MKRILGVVAAAVVLAAVFPARADEREHERRESPRARQPMGHWQGREIRRFHERDFDTWRRGHWYHGEHEGRLGWWWLAAGIWYFYPAPVYPYPDPYAPPILVTPPVVVVPQAPPQPPAVEPPPAPQYWYYCASRKAYYPYVPNCPEAWKPVPAQPPQAPR